MIGQAQVLTLDSCFCLAMKNNLRLKNAELETERARQVRYQALTKYFPNISLQAFSFHALQPLVQIGAQDIINGISNTDLQEGMNKLYEDYGKDADLDEIFHFFQYGVTAGATAVQPVFTGGQIVNGNRLAKLGVQSAELQAKITEREVMHEVEETYLIIVGLENKKATLQAVTDLLDTLTADVNTAIAAGLTTKNDLLKIELKRRETESQQLQLENGIRLAKQALCRSIGREFSDSIILVDDTTYNIKSDSMPRPEHELLELSVRAEQLKKKMEIGKALPQIAVGGTYAYTRFFQDKNQHNGMLFATVQVPLTQWWETGHKIKEMNLQTEIARNTQQHINEQMELQLIQAEQEVIVAEKQLDLCHKTIENAEENLRMARINYEAGMLPISDLLEARTLLVKAENDLTDARLQLHLAKRKLEECK